MVQKKLPITHFEKFLSTTKKRMGKDLISLCKDALLLRGDAEGEAVDDNFFSAMLESIYGFRETDMKSPLMLNEFRSLRSILFHLWHFGKRRKIYRFEEGITAKLLRTHVKKVDSVFVKSPFKSIFLSLPYNNELMIHNSATGLHKVVGIYVFVEDIQDKELSLNLNPLVPGTYQKVSDAFEEKPTTLFRLLAIGEPKPEVSPLGEDDDATYFATFFLSPGDVFPQVEDHIEKWTTSASAEEKVQLKKIFHFVLNALLYITSGPNDINVIRAKFETAGGKGREAKRRAEMKNAGLSKIDQMSVGGSIRLSSTFKEAYNSGSLGQYSIGCPKWMVSGHWRNQAHGEGMQLRKMIWVEPYEKGKGFVEDLKARSTVVS